MVHHSRFGKERQPELSEALMNSNLWLEAMLQAAIYELEIWVDDEDSIDRCRGVCFKF